MATLLLAEGVTSEDGQESVSTTGAHTVKEPARVEGVVAGDGHLVREMHELVDASLAQGVVSSEEAMTFRELLERMDGSQAGSHA